MKRKNGFKTVFIMILLVFVSFCSTPSFLFAEEAAQAVQAPEPVPDPSGTSTGGAADVIGATTGAPTADDMKNMAAAEPLAAKLADVVGHNRIAINIVWTLVCGFLVMFMQAGFRPCGNGLYAGQECRPYHGDEFHGLCHRHAGILDMRICHPDGRRRRCGLSWRGNGFKRRVCHQSFRKGFRIVRNKGLFPFRRDL